MTVTKELYDEFWVQFQSENLGWPSASIGRPFKAVHTTAEKPKPYFDFDKDLGLGFRGTAVISRQKNQLRAELSTDRRGVEFVNFVQQNRNRFDAPQGFVFEPYIGKTRTDAKIQVVWDNANVAVKQLWPAHQLWLKLSLELLVVIFGQEIEGWATA